MLGGLNNAVNQDILWMYKIRPFNVQLKQNNKNKISTQKTKEIQNNEIMQMAEDLLNNPGGDNN